jgi:hypothetical protein
LNKDPAEKLHRKFHRIREMRKTHLFLNEYVGYEEEDRIQNVRV